MFIIYVLLIIIHTTDDVIDYKHSDWLAKNVVECQFYINKLVKIARDAFSVESPLLV